MAEQMFDPNLVAEKLADIDVDVTTKGGSGSNMSTPERQRPTLPTRAGSNKEKAGAFRPQLETIYSMKSEMDLSASTLSMSNNGNKVEV